MCDESKRIVSSAVFLALAGLVALPSAAATTQGKIVCWKDKSGKVIGCGDKVPPEFQSSATKELDSRGVTRGQTESVEDTTRRRLHAEEEARVRAENERKMVAQKRQDTALLETYSNEKEIDAKRDRDLQIIDLQIEQLAVSLKNATQRYNETKSRVEAVEKSNKPVGGQLKDDLTRASNDKQRFEKGIEAKNREKDELRQRYAEQRKRYIELRTNPQASSAPPAPASASAAAKK